MGKFIFSPSEYSIKGYAKTNVIYETRMQENAQTSWGRAGPSSAQAWLKLLTELVYFANLICLG